LDHPAIFNPEPIWAHIAGQIPASGFEDPVAASEAEFLLAQKNNKTVLNETLHGRREIEPALQ